MLTLYFSGTGNTKYIAEKFSNRMNSLCYSIEDDVDFFKLLYDNTVICVCYPIYGSRVPRIMKEFIAEYMQLFKGKQVIILVTQYIGSGDGARAFWDLFPSNHFNIIYAEHINMPNNICNFAILPVKNGEKNNRKLKKADTKLEEICKNIRCGKIIKRGFNPVSKLLGLVQGAFEEIINSYGRSSVAIDNDCIACGLCVKFCPMKNLELVNGKIETKDNCALCCRCVNLCPEMAITSFFHKKPKKQYKGL